MIQETSPDETEDFSLGLGGPLYQLYLRSHLARPPLDLLRRRVIVFSCLTWLPLLPLSIIAGVAYSGPQVPFLFDIDVHARFLVALPMLIIAEFVLHDRLRFALGQFLDRRIVRGEEIQRFNQILANTMRWRDSVVVEVLMLLFVFSAGHYIWQHYTSLPVATWYGSPVGRRTELTLPGYWYVYFGVPVFQFILLRWYYRIFLWYRLLWKISNLRLCLIATHPDHAGGLNFLGASAYGFVPIYLAHMVMLSGKIASHILNQGASLLAYRVEILGFVIGCLIFLFTPYSFFWFQLWKIKRAGLRQFGLFATEYVQDFQEKWIDGVGRNGESPLGSGDIQSLADLGNSYQIAEKMRLFPFSRETLLRIAITLALPVAPLVLTLVPLDKMIDRFLGVIL